MKLRILLGISLTLNALVVAFVTTAWLNPGLFAAAWLKAHVERRTSFFERHPVKPQDIVFLGDSITEGGEWNELFPGANTRNRGIGGDTTTGVLERLNQITRGEPGAVFIKIGTNDLTHGPSERQQSYAQYRSIVSRILQESPRTTVYLQSILPREEKYRDEVEAFNLEIQDIAGDLSVTYIDLYPHFLAEDGSISNEFSNDELHLKGEGYDLWLQQLLTYIEQERG